MLRDREALRTADVAAALGTARSSAHRMLTTLQAHGLLQQNPTTKTYHAGPELIELGIAVMRATDLRAEGRPYLEELARTTGETTHILVLEGTTIVFVDGVESQHVLRAGLRTGSRTPAHPAAAGKALLAALDPKELRRRYPNSRLNGGTDRAVASRQDLEKELQAIRGRGYALNLAESETGLHAMGAHVTNRTGVVRCGLSVSGPAERLTADRMAELAPGLVETCRRLGQGLN